MSAPVANKIRVAEVAPPACSSCFQQNVDEPHVDFGAYWDGPVLDGAKAMQIDDLVICRTCLAEAVRVLPGIDEVGKERLERLVEENAVLRAANEGQAVYIGKLEDAVAAKPKKAR
jgi:hypothetical protein